MSKMNQTQKMDNEVAQNTGIEERMQELVKKVEEDTGFSYFNWDEMDPRKLVYTIVQLSKSMPENKAATPEPIVKSLDIDGQPIMIKDEKQETKCPACESTNIIKTHGQNSFYCIPCGYYFTADKPVSKQIVLCHIIDDLHARADTKEKLYGKKFMTHNGHNPLKDAYIQILDTCMYLKKALLEQEE